MRVRPYTWSEVFEEGNEWVFRRRRDERRISPDEVEQVVLVPNGAVVVRFGKTFGEPLAFFFPTSKSIDGVPVVEYMDQRAAKARRLRHEESTTLAPLESGRISSRWTFAIKHLLTWFGVGGLAIWLILSWGGMAVSGEWSAFKVVAPLLAAIIGFVFHHEYLSNLADEVVIKEEGLSIRLLRQQQFVPYPEIEELEYRPFGGHHWIVLHLKTPHPLGRKIAVIPDGRGSIYGWNPRLDALAKRIGKRVTSPCDSSVTRSLVEA